VIQNNFGIIVKPRDSQALVEAIIRLLKNLKLAKKMGKMEESQLRVSIVGKVSLNRAMIFIKE